MLKSSLSRSVAIALTLGAAFAAGGPPAAQAEHSISVASANGAVAPVGNGYYRVTFNTHASSSEPCRNWGDAADAWSWDQDGGHQLVPVDRSDNLDPSNGNQSQVDFSWAYEAPAGSQVRFASRVGCDTVTHIGGEGFGDPVSVTIPNDQDVCEGPNNVVKSVETKSGHDYGLTGTQLYHGQVVKFTEATDVRLGDGTYLELSKGDRIEVVCGPNARRIDLFAIVFSELLSGTLFTSITSTPRAVITPRGWEIPRRAAEPRTGYSVEYEKGQQRTTVKVKSGKVEVQARRGSKRKVVARKGETVVQVGKKAPRLVEP